MQELSGEITTNKEQRQVEIDRNNDLRERIKTAIDDYNATETNYKEVTGKFGEMMQHM